MNLQKRLEHIAYLSSKDRAFGKTSMIVKAAKETGGIVIAATHAEAKEIERKFGVTSRSIEINLDGFTGPFFVDHHAMEKILLNASAKIGVLESELAASNEKHKELQDKLDSIQEILGFHGPMG